jgi:glycosyltransferase involved in cell wall biosynthesis
LAAILNTSDVFVLVSEFEGLPSALLEAMACGVPTVVHSNGADSIGLRHRLDTLMCDGSPKNIASMISEYRANHDLAKQVAREGRRYVLEYHDSRNTKKRVWKKLIEILEEGGI